jgi:hypothetical protein
MTTVEGRVKKAGSIAFALLLLLAPLVIGAMLAFGVWSLTGRLVGGSFIHYLWRLPVCAYVFCVPLGTVVQLIFGRSGNLSDLDTPEPQRQPSPRKDQ